MIIILFTAGNFGTTLEFCLHNYSKELIDLNPIFDKTGSMHTFAKQGHVTSVTNYDTIKEMLPNTEFDILTPVYPSLDGLSPKDSVTAWLEKFSSDDRGIFVYNATRDQAIRTQLFAYHKVPDWLDVIINKNKAAAWNSKYNNWSDMQRYELREALSFYFDNIIDDFEAEQVVPANWYKITPDDILWDFEKTIKNLINHAGLTYNQKDIDQFYQTWRSKQQYILDDYNLIDDICKNMLINDYFEWPELSVVDEAIIQSELRKQGIEINITGLNVFPQSNLELRKYFQHYEY